MDCRMRAWTAEPSRGRGEKPHSRRSGRTAARRITPLPRTTAGSRPRLIGALVASGAGRRFRKAEPLAIDFPNGRVVVEPNELAELPDGTVVLRRVRTGYRRKDEYDGLEYTLYHLAGAERIRRPRGR